jgi:hypothetical protein
VLADWFWPLVTSYAMAKASQAYRSLLLTALLSKISFMQGIKSFLKEVLADRQGKKLSFTSIRNKTRTHVPFLVANVLKNFIFILIVFQHYII